MALDPSSLPLHTYYHRYCSAALKSTRELLFDYTISVISHYRNCWPTSCIKLKTKNIWIQSRTTAVHCCIVSSSYALVHWSEQLRPVAAFEVTEAGVVPDHHVAITDLLQRTQAEIIQVRYVQSCKTDAATTFTREVKTETLFKGEKYLFFHDKNRFNMQRQQIICKLTWRNSLLFSSSSDDLQVFKGTEGIEEFRPVLDQQKSWEKNSTAK